MKKGSKKNGVTIENLAVMVAKGFEHVEGKMDLKFEAVNKRLDDIDYRLGKI